MWRNEGGAHRAAARGERHGRWPENPPRAAGWPFEDLRPDLDQTIVVVNRDPVPIAPVTPTTPVIDAQVVWNGVNEDGDDPATHARRMSYRGRHSAEHRPTPELVRPAPEVPPPPVRRDEDRTAFVSVARLTELVAAAGRAVRR